MLESKEHMLSIFAEHPMPQVRAGASQYLAERVFDGIRYVKSERNVRPRTWLAEGVDGWLYWMMQRAEGALGLSRLE